MLVGQFNLCSTGISVDLYVIIISADGRGTDEVEGVRHGHKEDI